MRASPLPSPTRRAWLRAGSASAALAALPLRLRAAAKDDANEDHRAWQHGVDLLRVGGKLLAIWGSAGNPPRPNLGGDWPHDIYSAWIEPGSGYLAINPQVLVARPEAQEPPSAAINSGGVILITAEDGEDGINQRAGLWDAALRPLRPYPYTIRKGGHSGHAAALGERFLIVYGEGWQDGGGFMDRGTGRDIHARIVAGDGKPGAEIHLANGHRDGWPQVAAGEKNWLAVWQRYDGLALYAATISPTGQAGAARRVAQGLPQRYAYDVAWAAALQRYVVAGNSAGAGFVALLDSDGQVHHLQGGLPPLVSEARILIGGSAAGPGTAVTAVYPVSPRGVAVLRLEVGAAQLVRVVDYPHQWDYMGSTGLFIEPARVLFVTLSLEGTRAFCVDF
jgi:hypothetical protein